MGERYDKEFKLYAVKMMVEDGYTSGWNKYKEDQEDSFVESGNRNPVDKAIYEKGKQIRDLEEEIINEYSSPPKFIKCPSSCFI